MRMQLIRGFGIEQLGRIDDKHLIASFERLKIEHFQKTADLRNLDLRRFVFHRDGHHIGMRTRVDFPAA